MFLLKIIFSIIIGFSSGFVISGAVFAFISKIGVVPRLAQKTNTSQYIRLYEEIIIAGGIFGTLNLPIGYEFTPWKIIIVIFSFCFGVFFGVLAVSLAEVIDVIPILSRRGRIQKGMFYFILAIAIGKLIGSLLYYIVPGFYTN